jgi:vacuolar-type H+-ATPase subunit F/Vma7
MTWVDVVARARGLASRLADDRALAAVAASRDPAGLAAAVAAAGYRGVGRAGPAAIERALRARAAAELAILVRWADDRAAGLAPLVDDEDRRSLRAIARGVVAGTSSDARLAGTIATPQLPEAALRALAAQPTAVATYAVLARRGHPFAAALAAELSRAPVDLIAVEIALGAAFAARGRRARDPGVAAHVAQVIDGDNAAAALLLSARGRGVDPDACFAAGGVRLGRAAYLAAATGPPAAARRVVAAAFTATPVARAVLDGEPGALDGAILSWQLATQARLVRAEPGGLAAVVWQVLRRRREAHVIRRAAWRLASDARAASDGPAAEAARPPAAVGGRARAAVSAVCRRPAALGLGLAGLACHEAADGGAAAAAIAAIGRQPEGHGGVILIERALHEALPMALRRQLGRDGLPILVPLPGPALGLAGPPPEEELLEILRRAIGYRLRLR